MKRVLFSAVCLIVAVMGFSQAKVIAHRGYWKTDGSAQNSIRSLVKADSVKVFGSEFDVWLTSDDKVVVNHDRVFKGVDFEHATLDEVRNVRLDNGEKVPTLDEYLSEACKHPDMRLILELKSLTDMEREDKAAEIIVADLKKYGLLGRTDIICFSINACIQFKKLCPVGVKIYYLDGDLPPKKIAKLGLAGVDYSMKALRKHPEWIKQAHDLGLEVNVWTVDKEEDMKYFLGQGVDYLTTNHPEQALKLVNAK